MTTHHFQYWKSVREALIELADFELQQKLWMSEGSIGTEVSSFAEAVDKLFTDTGLGDLLDKGTLGIGKDAETLLRSLEAELRKIDTSHGPLRTIYDPNMVNVRDLANRLLDMVPREN